MGIFSNQMANVVEWQEFRDDVIFWKWANSVLKKNSRLVIRPGQDAIFLYNGRIEGIFTDEGNYEISSQIIPFLSSLKNYQFGFKNKLRAEVLFVNTKEFNVKWGTKNSINIPAPGLPGGLPIRAFGTFQMRVSDYVNLIDRVAGIKRQFDVDDVKERVVSMLDQLLMRWVVKEGKDMFNLQANAAQIAAGVRQDLDMEMVKLGLSITGFTISSVNYPEEIQKNIERTAGYSMVGDINRYQSVGMTDAMIDGGGGEPNAMSGVIGMAAVLKMSDKMFNQQGASGEAARTCPKCGGILTGQGKFCPLCGADTLNQQARTSDHKPAFCPWCGAKMEAGHKFCASCGKQI